MFKKNTITSELPSSGYLEQLISKEHAEIFSDEKYLQEIVPTSRKAKSQREKVVKFMAEYSKTGKIEADRSTRAALEAIILPHLRPAFDIITDTYKDIQMEEWSILNQELVKTRLENIIPSIGRIEIPTNSKIPFAGTGFLVSKDIIMTNRHVAELFCRGLGINGLRFSSGHRAGIDFKEEYGTSRDEDVFFDIRDVLMIHPYWDMALLRVTAPDEFKNKTPLSLSLTTPEELEGKNIAVIGYPAFDPRNDGAEQMRIFNGKFDIKRLQPGKITGRKTIRSYDYFVKAMKHDASTLGGNSGSAVINLDNGEVVGLHFAGKYRDSNYAVPISELAKDDYIQRQYLNFIGDLPDSDYHWQPAWTNLNQREINLNSKVDNSDLAKDDQNTTASSILKCPATITAEGSLAITIPVEFTTSPSKSSGSLINTIKEDDVDPEVEKDNVGFYEGFVGNYADREGYDHDFLGITVPIPWLSEESYLKVARNSSATDQRHVLTYTNFSIVMNSERRLAFFSAVNIDGGKKEKIPKKSGVSHSWYYDKRISRVAQMNNDYYKDAGGSNPLDRGHIVRRIEPTWGSNKKRIVAAHNDTFHWTNCSPQHTRFNKQGFLWATIENFLLDNAKAESEKISVFSGPAFRDSDPLYMAPAGVQFQVPTEFWKVVAYKIDGELKVRAFLLSQEREVKSMIEALDYSKYSEFQLSIAELETVLSGSILFENHQFNFDFKEHDAFSTDQEGLVEKKKLNSLKDIL